MDWTIEPARPDDFAGILMLLDRCQLPEAGLADHLGNALVIRDGERIVGSAALELYDRAALLRSVAVAEPLRGQGLGERLTQAALDLARRHGVIRVYLLTTTAGEFFPRFGFQQVPRDQVPLGVQASVEFTTACPASAMAMMASL